MKIIVKDVRVNPVTGYMEVDVVAVRENGNSRVEGPVKTYGADAHILATRYSGNIALWLAGVKGTHQEHMGLHESLSEQLLAYKGKEL